jgi:hypothetical protein
MLKIKSTAPWAYRLAMCGLVLVGMAILFASPVVVPAASAQVVISVNPPVCVYGYYEYEPYGCAPMGFYGPGYFFNGIFLGVGPWSNWGYNHGWGGHRFSGGGGGRYVAGHRDGGARPSAGRGGERGGSSHATANRGGASHATAAHNNTAHASGGASHASASHASAAHASGGGASHGGGGASHGGGGGGGHR